ncbi:acyl-CoA ligase (AMP-forming), exosortase A system-associated [Rhodoferax sp.]|uniref:acyl-CoA ligase (AMP-forming), exosortase A system-associated n=1 Tax=Rhodoferax sp. TaxID=50421 RepID=UPI00283D5E83|nr:acyl-CoA ligase (AMP-forming), exosortase A system-associated [Rhodoferax sp.]MDR3368477.1 acyl-CoA ligase (AMP-forming), exosortase A system-associated [Rhodoferax sp.]
MSQATLLPELVTLAAQQRLGAIALTYGPDHWTYAELADAMTAFASGLLALNIQRADRVGIYLEKRFEAVAASFAAPLAGAVFVPINPLLKADQVAHILRDCNVRVLVTSSERLAMLAQVLRDCPDLQHVVLCAPIANPPDADATHWAVTLWQDLLTSPRQPGHRVIDTDLAAILYTSGSTGQPKGVMLSHRNLVAGAKSVASYLHNQPSDTLLAALPLSFDAGFSQLTTAFHAGARVVLLNYLLPRDVLKALEQEKVTGLTAVPPLYLQLVMLDWPDSIGEHLRYFANTGGHLPREALVKLRQRVPKAAPYLMYGLTEAFRSTYLPPHEVDRRPDSIGQAIPNAEVLVLRSDGSPCTPDEPGELVHRGALVAMGYWNDAEKTAERFRPLPPDTPGRPLGLQLPEIAVFSGDTVRRDTDGFLYFVGRRDEMIKTSGYRVSPTEVEDVLYATGLVNECIAFGVPHDVLGQAIQIIASCPVSMRARARNDLMSQCRSRMPTYMVPAAIEWVEEPLPRNANGKIDRARLARDWLERQNHAPVAPASTN